MKTVIAICLMLIIALALYAEPNDPNAMPVGPYEIASLRAITQIEKKALEINGTTLQQVIDRMLRHEVAKAKRRIVEDYLKEMMNDLTLIEIQTKLDLLK